MHFIGVILDFVYKFCKDIPRACRIERSGYWFMLNYSNYSKKKKYLEVICVLYFPKDSVKLTIQKCWHYTWKKKWLFTDSYLTKNTNGMILEPIKWFCGLRTGMNNVLNSPGLGWVDAAWIKNKVKLNVGRSSLPSRTLKWSSYFFSDSWTPTERAGSSVTASCGYERESILLSAPLSFPEWGYPPLRLRLRLPSLGGETGGPIGGTGTLKRAALPAGAPCQLAQTQLTFWSAGCSRTYVRTHVHTDTHTKPPTHCDRPATLALKDVQFT